MKYIAALTGILLITIASSASALPSNDCAARSEKLPLTERDDFLKTCLAEVSAPTKIKEAKHKHKTARCEQNAKNMKLQGQDKGSYQEECVNKNEAVEVASNMPKPGAEASEKPVSADSGKTAGKKKPARKSAEKKQTEKKHKEHKKSGKKAEAKPAAESPVAESK